MTHSYDSLEREAFPTNISKEKTTIKLFEIKCFQNEIYDHHGDVFSSPSQQIPELSPSLLWTPQHLQFGKVQRLLETDAIVIAVNSADAHAERSEERSFC